MALKKGNAMALQALRPLPELKVADLASNIINTFEKTQAVKESARLKALEEEKKGIREFTEKSQVKSFATIPSITDQSSKLFRDTADYIGELGLMAEKDPSKKYEYQSLMQKASNNYTQLATTFGSADFVKSAQEKLEAFKNQDYFMDSDTKDRLELISSGMLQMQMDKSTGEIKFALPRNANSKPDEPAKWYTAGEVQSWYTKPEELDWINTTNANKGNTFPKELSDLAKVLGDEYSNNKDGNKTIGWKGFAEDRANTWFDSRFGGFKNNAVDPRLNQFAKRTFGSEIDSEEEYNAVKKAVIDNIGSQVPKEDKIDTRKTAVELEGDRLANEAKRLDIALKKKELAKPYTQSGGNDNAGNAGFRSVSADMVNKSDKVIVQIRGNTGEVKGVQLWSANTVPLPKVKGFPATVNTFGLSKFTNKKGQIVPTIIMGAPADDGKTVYSKISPSDFSQYVSKSGYDPYDVLEKLEKNNNTSNRYTGKVDSSKDIYNNVKIGQQAKSISGGTESIWD